MSDARLRLLERRWKQTSALEDEVAYLLARTREGDVSQDQLELAAALGYRPASEVLGPTGPEVFRSARAMLDELETWGDEALVRSGLAILSLVPPLGISGLSGTLSAARAWLRRPTTKQYDLFVRRLHDHGRSLPRSYATAALGFTRLALREAKYYRLRPREVQAALRDHLVPWVLGWDG